MTGYSCSRRLKFFNRNPGIPKCLTHRGTFSVIAGALVHRCTASSAHWFTDVASCAARQQWADRASLSSYRVGVAAQKRNDDRVPSTKAEAPGEKKV